MGLHDSLLNVPERLRVWQQAGVRHLYLDPDADGHGVAASAAPIVEPFPNGNPEATVASVQANTANAARHETPHESQASGQAATPFVPDEPAYPGPEDCNPEPAVRPSSLAVPDDPDVGPSAGPDAWPDPWPSLFARTPPKPRLVITYAALGQDLTGQADPRRGNLWRTLIERLGLAGRNAVAFWPVGLPASDDPSGDLDIFVAGCQLLAPRVVAVFGDAAACLVKPCATRLSGIRLACFPDPRPLLRGDTEAWDHVLSVLGQP